MPEAPVFEHRMTRRVQFHETDLAGVVHFSRFFLYMEEAEHALWRAAGLSIHPRAAETVWPRVHASFEFHRALRFEEEFEVQIRIEAIEEKTIAYVCELRRGGTKVATGRMTIACASRRGNGPMRAAAIPAAIRERLAPAPKAVAGASAPARGARRR